MSIRNTRKALAALYHPACSLVQRDGAVACGPRAIREVLARLIAMRPSIIVRTVKVVTAGSDHAMVYSAWCMAERQDDGQPVEVAGKAIEVVQRRADGVWLFLLDDPFARD
jgi:ketosteroid isomerase-like protein